MLLIALFSGMQTAGTSDVVDLVGKSSFAFKGTVKKLRASALPIFPATDNTAVVTVDEVLRGANSVGNFAGQDITVQMLNVATKKGDQIVFFCNVAAYGESIAVVEVGRINAPRRLETTREQITQAEAVQADRQLTARLAQAELVLQGQVTQVGQLRERPTATSEHDPEWQRAVVTVDTVFKGQPPQGSVAVLYPGSMDIRWFRSPKLKSGQRGIFILHLAKNEELGVEGYTMIDPLDFQPPDQADRIKRLIAAMR